MSMKARIPHLMCQVRSLSKPTLSLKDTISGYTIVEVMIFLGVSGALFFSVMLLVSGQQGRTEFSQSIRDFQSTIEDTANDVATGYYTSSGSFICTARAPISSVYTSTSRDYNVPDGTSPLNPGGSFRPITGMGTPTQGTNQTCTFIGNALHFVPRHALKNELRIYAVAGRRLDPQLDASGRPKLVENLSRALPTAIQKGQIINSLYIGGSGKRFFSLHPSMRFSKITYVHPTDSAVDPPRSICGFGFFTTLNQSGANGLTSGATSTDLIPFDSRPSSPDPLTSTCELHENQLGSPGNPDQQTFTDLLHNSMVADGTGGTGQPVTVNPSSGITICVINESKKQYALLTVGGANSGKTKLEIFDGDAYTLDEPHCRPNP